jgi:hypothetical protein
MLQRIVRDDDISFFTRPEMLEAVYSQLWARSFPVCISVIPAHRSDVRVLHRPGMPYEPNVPPEYRGLNEQHLITQNHELCMYLNQKAREGTVEICLHGYNHEYMEFVSDDVELLMKKLIEGRRILEDAFPDASIRTFTAPYDCLTKTALETVLDCEFDVCTSSANLLPIAALSSIGGYQAFRLNGGRKLFTCDEYLFDFRNAPGECLANARARLQTETTFICANHYWSFYRDWKAPNEELFEEWNCFLDEFLVAPETHITTFHDGECVPLN